LLRPRSRPARSRFGLARPDSALRLLPLALALGLWAPPASATFHRNEITKLLVGFDGNTNVQAVELKMLTDGENHVRGLRIDAYDGDAVLLASLGTFNDSLPFGIAGRFFLCATSSFATQFGITPDLVITPGIPVQDGQVAFEQNPILPAPCLVNSLPYGNVTTPMGSASVAPPLQAVGARALIRVIDLAGSPSCPLAEDAGHTFHETWGTSAKPVVFKNNRGDSVSVFSTTTAVDADIRDALGRPRIYPNPVFSSATIEWPGVPLSHVAIYNVRGQRVREWGSAGARGATGGPAQIRWDGTDENRRRLPSGLYFIRIGATARQFPVVLLR